MLGKKVWFSLSREEEPSILGSLSGRMGCLWPVLPTQPEFRWFTAQCVSGFTMSWSFCSRIRQNSLLLKTNNNNNKKSKNLPVNSLIFKWMIIYVFDFFFFNLTSLINCIICRGKTIWLICPEIMAQISDWHQYNSKHYKSLNSDSVPTRIKSLWWIPLAVLPTSVSWTNVRN